MDVLELNEHRKALLRQLIRVKFEGNEQELGRALGYNDGGYIRAMLREGKFSRPITEKTVAKIEALPGLGGWFSKNVSDATPPALGGGVTRRRARGAMYVPIRSVPVLSSAELKYMSFLNEDPRLAGSPRVPVAADTGPRAKAIYLPDDSMMPMRAGDLIHLDPDLLPHAGDKVLVEDSSGNFYIREYRLRSGGAFEAAASNPAHATLHSETDGLKVIAVATHVTQTLRNGVSKVIDTLSAGLLSMIGFVVVGTALYMGDFGSMDVVGSTRRVARGAYCRRIKEDPPQ